MLKRIPRQRPTGGKAPRRAYPLFTHFQDLNGRPALSLWWNTSHPSLPPLFSFQIYVTHDSSPTDHSAREALASELYEKVLGEYANFQRVDIHFMHPGEETADCVATHRAHVQARSSELSQAVIPTYHRWLPSYSHSFIYIVHNKDWEQDGIKGVWFDSARPTASADDIHEINLVDFEIEEQADILFCEWRLRDEYMDLFSDAENAGMTDWREVFKAANRLGMDQW